MLYCTVSSILGIQAFSRFHQSDFLAFFIQREYSGQHHKWDVRATHDGKSEARVTPDSDKTQTNKLIWWMILRGNAGFP